MKSNDDIPQDEMLLAEAIAAVRFRRLGWTEGTPFRSAAGNPCKPIRAVKCCALGAIYFAGRVSLPQITDSLGEHLDDVNVATNRIWFGNDDSPSNAWSLHATDLGESLGWAFRCAMTQEEP